MTGVPSGPARSLPRRRCTCRATCASRRSPETSRPASTSSPWRCRRHPAGAVPLLGYELQVVGGDVPALFVRRGVEESGRRQEPARAPAGRDPVGRRRGVDLGQALGDARSQLGGRVAVLWVRVAAPVGARRRAARPQRSTPRSRTGRRAADRCGTLRPASRSRPVRRESGDGPVPLASQHGPGGRLPAAPAQGAGSSRCWCSTSRRVRHGRSQPSQRRAARCDHGHRVPARAPRHGPPGGRPPRRPARGLIRVAKYHEGLESPFMRTPRAPDLQGSRGGRVSEGRHATYAHGSTALTALSRQGPGSCRRKRDSPWTSRRRVGRERVK